MHMKQDSLTRKPTCEQTVTSVVMAARTGFLTKRSFDLGRGSTWFGRNKQVTCSSRDDLVYATVIVVSAGSFFLLILYSKFCEVYFCSKKFGLEEYLRCADLWSIICKMARSRLVESVKGVFHQCTAGKRGRSEFFGNDVYT